VPRANHQRIVCAVAFLGEVDTGSRQENASELDEQLQWQQVAVQQKKAGARQAFSQSWELR
jgi:hypothetical protein